MKKSLMTGAVLLVATAAGGVAYAGEVTAAQQDAPYAPYAQRQDHQDYQDPTQGPQSCAP